MPSLVANVVERYKSSLRYRDLQHFWSKFSEWTFDYLESNLTLLSEAVGPSPLQNKLAFVSDLKGKHAALVTEYAPKMLNLSPESLPEVKAALSKALNPWCRVDNMGGFNDDDLWGYIEDSQLYKTLKGFNRDKVIDRIMDLPENFTDDDLARLKDIDVEPYKAALDRVRRVLPDFEHKPGDEGSYEAFEVWVRGLPTNFEVWEDTLPFSEDNLADQLSETRVGISLNRLLGTYYFFPTIQEDARNLKAALLKMKFKTG